eukprot:TRINITY_DN25059_c0_g1_i1.p1 TRINITY_DN25059_c0_g1~~TRINITY_DN25059_c0_g1_i1.p1  ORF type:complete len:362 (+),score=76.60 TRINITY_DN25059_c0_g1_i1:130-1215(+)
MQTKAKTAMVARSKKAKDNSWQYTLWIGLSIGSVIVAIAALVFSPDKGPGGRPVNDQTLIAWLNRNMKTWRAGPSAFFEGWTLGDMISFQGLGLSPLATSSSPCAVQDVPLPESFDAREKWPHCFNSPIYNSGNCTASWAIATASSLSNRFCISKPEKYTDLMLSPQELLSCDSSNRGCSGGDLDSVWRHVERSGLVSELCFPYQADSSVSCDLQCPDGERLKAAGHCMLGEEKSAMKEIFTNGPAVALVFLNDDLLVYKGGVYQESKSAKPIIDKSKQRLMHAVKLVGWGVAAGTKYWLVENSWGEDWGESGYGRIVRGIGMNNKGNVLLEGFMMAGTPFHGLGMDLDPDADADLDDLDD